MSQRSLLVGIGTALAVALGGLALVWFAQTQHYTVQGRVAGIEDGGRTLFVEHEKIPGYMPAMTMPLPVADPDMTAPLTSGDAIQFRLSVSGDSAWISALQSIPDTAVARHPARTIRPMPGDRGNGRRRLQEGDRVPADLTLTTQAGNALRLGDFRGRALVLTFIYTRCPLPNYCPLMSKQFAALQPKLRAEFGTRVHLLSVSFDPAYDTPAVLRDYAAKYTDRLDTWTFATGDSTEIQRVTRRFGVYTKREEGQITHNLTTAVIGPDGTVHRLFRGNDWTPPDIVQALRQVLGENMQS